MKEQHLKTLPLLLKHMSLFELQKLHKYHHFLHSAGLTTTEPGCWKDLLIHPGSGLWAPGLGPLWLPRFQP